MAFLLRLRKFPTFPTHHRLLSTSDGVSGSSDPNSTHPSPSSEIRKAVKRLDPTVFPPPKTFRPPLSVEVLKDRITRFNDRYAIDRDFLADMKVFRHDLLHRILKTHESFTFELTKHVRYGTIAQPETRETLRKQVDELIVSFKRLEETAAEDVVFSKELNKPTLTALEKIVEDFSRLSLKHDDEDSWNELHEVVLRRMKMQVEQAKLVVKDITKDKAFASHHIKLLSEIRRQISETGEDV